MIHKLLYIKNCGRFVNCTLTPSDWDGVFGNINTIYAENGSGKTTFTQILKSLSGKDVYQQFVSRRKTLQTKEAINISFILNNSQKTIFYGCKWSQTVEKIEIYDTYYAESNVYIISLGSHNSPSEFFKLILSQSEKDLLGELLCAIKKQKRAKTTVRRLQEFVKSQKGLLEEKWISKLEQAKLMQNKSNEERREIEHKIDDLIEDCGAHYLKSVNSYLSRFNPNLKLVKLNKKGASLVYHLQINGILARGESSNVSLRHSLSEGDKSSLSLSFFLARLDLMPDLSDRIIVFDDPLSSFDTRRRSMTASILSRVAKNVKQFFLLSHDLNFIKDFCNKVDESQNLKIEWIDGTSKFIRNKVELESMTGISKDIFILQRFAKYGSSSDFERRDVARCIRPAIEGIFRLKYFSLVKDNEWLGDFLKHIRDCDNSSPLYRLKNGVYDKLSDINEYSQKYHHSNPKYMEEPIYDQELALYVNMTLDTIMYI